MDIVPTFSPLPPRCVGLYGLLESSAAVGSFSLVPGARRPGEQGFLMARIAIAHAVDWRQPLGSPAGDHYECVCPAGKCASPFTSSLVQRFFERTVSERYDFKGGTGTLMPVDLGYRPCSRVDHLPTRA